MGRIYSELSSAEKKVDSFIESLRREELREADCGREVDGCVPSIYTPALF
jgi:dynactin 1